MIFLAFNILIRRAVVHGLRGDRSRGRVFFDRRGSSVTGRQPADAGNRRSRSGRRQGVSESSGDHDQRRSLVIIFILLFIFKDRPTAIGFVIGAFCSLSAGFIGMRIAVVANVRTTQAATAVDEQSACEWPSTAAPLRGCSWWGSRFCRYRFSTPWSRVWSGTHMAVKSLVGLALGASLISVFARLGGGIYTKAADVGADLVGKIEKGLEEDDPRNPATIADNVGDNVGDCAGMAADVFETYAVSLIGAILVGALTLPDNPAAVIYPFVLGGISVLGAILGVLFVNFAGGKPATVLMGGSSRVRSFRRSSSGRPRTICFPNGVMIAGVDALTQLNSTWRRSSAWS